MRLTVNHATTYRFDPAKRGLIQSHRLTPSVFDGQQVIDWQIGVAGAEFLRGASFRDGAGDWIETVKTLGPVEEVTVTVTGEVETVDLNGVLQGHREKVPPEAYLRPTRATRADLALTELAEVAVRRIGAERALERAHALCQAVNDAIAYTPGQTEHGTTASEALALGHGVCQDHAHAVIASAQAVGLPGRYVTGYLFASQEGGAEEASHAWAEVHVAGLGWVGFDASNGVCPDDRYIRLGSGADAAEAAPIRGIARGVGDETLDVTVAVTQAQQ